MSGERQGMRAAVVSAVAVLTLAAGAVATAGVAHADPPGAPGGGLLTLPAPGQPTTIKGPNQVVYPADAEGRAQVIHGFNIKQSDLSNITKDTLAGIRVQGFNVLRLAVFWSVAEPQQGQWNEPYFAQISQILQWGNETGLSIVLDMHQDSYSELTGGFGIPNWATRTDGLPVGTGSAVPNLAAGNQRAWQHLYEDQDLRDAQNANWLEFANRFKDAPALYGYDLINEPFGQSNPGESLPDAGRRVEATQLTAMEQRLADTIRTVDTTHWLLVEPLFALTSSLAEPGGLKAINDASNRVIYAPHIYDLGMEAGTDWNPASDFVQRYWTNIVSYSQTNGVPFLVFEWGPQQPKLPNAPDYVEQVLRGVDQFAAGHAAFAWCKGLAGWCQLDADGHPGAAMAQTVAPYPTKLAGGPGEVRVDELAPRTTVTLVQPRLDQPTVFYVPSAAFPGEPPVTVTGAPANVSWDQATQTVSVQVTQATADVTIVVGVPASCPTAVTGGSPAWVRLAYLDLFGRCPDGNGLTYWSDQLDNGASTASVARYLASTPEADGVLVEGAYLQVLQRPADPGGKAYWANRQQNGQSYRALLAELAGSDELWNAAGQTNGAYVDLLYQRLLGRAADAGGHDYWVAQLEGGMSRRDIAGRFAGTTEALAHVVDASYQALLRRPPTDAELTAGVNSLKGDGDLGHLRATIVGGVEFGVLAQSFINTSV